MSQLSSVQGFLSSQPIAHVTAPPAPPVVVAVPVWEPPLPCVVLPPAAPSGTLSNVTASSQPQASAMTISAPRLPILHIRVTLSERPADRYKTGAGSDKEELSCLRRARAARRDDPDDRAGGRADERRREAGVGHRGEDAALPHEIV